MPEVPAVTTELAVALREFKLGEPLEPPVAVAEAWSNEVFRVITSDGVFAVKLFPSNLSASRRQKLTEAVEFERRVLAAGFAVPVPVPSDRGEVFVDFPVPAGIRTARCHHWMHGTPASQLVGESDLAAAAGAVLGRLHALRVAGGDTAQLAGPDQRRWDRAVTAAESAGVPWAGELAAHTPLVRRLADRVELLRQQRRPMQISHRDFDPKNAVIDEKGRLVVTDWDFAGPIVPGVELVTAASSFARSEEQLRRFAESYRDAGGGAEPADPLALSVEAADLDWLLRNVEAVVTDRLGADTDKFRTAADLIGSFATDLSDLESWSRRLQTLSCQTHNTL